MKKGNLAEKQAVEWLRANGWPYAERRVMGGRRDKGDVAGIPGVCLEVKCCARTELSAWVDEANVEARNAGVPIGVVVHKRRGKGNPADWFVTMDLRTFAALLEPPLEAAS